jgi:hypothetical protein
VPEQKTTAQQKMAELEREGLNDPEIPELPESRRFRTTGFARMPLDWKGRPTSSAGEDRDSDAMMIERIHSVVRRAIDKQFLDALEVLDELYGIVRTARVEDGEFLVDSSGHPFWETNELGMPLEDYSRLGSKERERFIYQITIRLFDWQSRSVEAWAEAMFAKALWEEEFAAGYEEVANPKATIEDRTARGRLRSRDARYFAIFKTYYSKQADVLVKSFELLNQRLKDMHQGT